MYKYTPYIHSKAIAPPIQVHRDTTIQSLTLLPLLEGGQIKYEDSPLVRAVKTGAV